MQNYYAYLISSLPFLKYGEKSPLSFDRFLSLCDGFIPEEDMRLIESIKGGPVFDYTGGQATMRKLRNYEICLRNDIVKTRASRKRIDPAPYLRAVEGDTCYSDHTVINAQRAANPLESAKVLDQARWQVLDELSIGHYFDIDILIAYAFKLKILERWDVIHKDNNISTLEKVLA